jgi:hypothetical protein
MGLSRGVFDIELFSAATLMVMVTTFLSPPLLKALLPAKPLPNPSAPKGIEDLAREA